MSISLLPLPLFSSHSQTLKSQQQQQRRIIPKRKSRHPPISISTNPSHLNPHHLQRLLYSANLSPHRFPLLSPDGRVAPVDIDKLTTAIAHSSIVVSVFCRDKFLRHDGGAIGFELLFERMAAAPDPDHRLVGFGRAVSDAGLTASIHDVVVAPSLQRLGIGRKIVERIVRILTNRGIYDISALCSEKERIFFEECGFGEDSLGSTTMMYTRCALSGSENESVIRSAGRMLLLVPQSQQVG